MTAGPCTVGLTGGLASGKSTAAALLAGLGAEVFDADAAVRELYRPGGAGARDVAFLFGEGVLDAGGGVDRAQLAERVLSDPAARRRLEGAIHPLVRTLIEDWLAGLHPEAVAVVEAALLAETGAWRRYDLLAVVFCAAEQQLERALSRGVPADRALALLGAQQSSDELRVLADVVIDNTGPPEALEAEVRRAWREITARCRER